MSELPGGLVARIRRFHRRGPGSIPGQGNLLCSVSSPDSPCREKLQSPILSPDESSLSSIRVEHVDETLRRRRVGRSGQSAPFLEQLCGARFGRTARAGGRAGC